MTPQDAALTDREPLWQTSWASEYLANEGYKKYAARVGDELIALAAYEILPAALVVHIVYMEAQPESNPTGEARVVVPEHGRGKSYRRILHTGVWSFSSVCPQRSSLISTVRCCALSGGRT